MTAVDGPFFNAYAAVVLAALVADYVLGQAARLLDLRALAPTPPPALAGAVDAATFQRSQEYARARIRLGLVVATVDLAVLLAFWWAGGFAVLDRWTRALGWGEIATGVAYVGVLVVGKTLVDLPGQVWSTFVVEERFGFNRTTPRTFVLDRVKGLAVAAVLGVPLLAAVLLFFHRLGDAAWLAAWAIAAAVTLLAQAIVPTWILPLFLRFEPLAEGDLRRAIESYADRVGFALSGVFVVDGSRRSSHGNAFFAGLGRNRRVALFDTLIEKHPTPEVVAVLAHEVGHYRRRHVPKMLALAVLHQGVLFYLLGRLVTSPGLHAAFGVAAPSIHTGLVFFLLLMAPLDLALSFGLHALSRRHEYEADRYALDTAPDPTAMATALRRLAADNLSNLTPHPFSVALRYTHPPVVSRLRALERHLPI